MAPPSEAEIEDMPGDELNHYEASSITATSLTAATDPQEATSSDVLVIDTTEPVELQHNVVIRIQEKEESVNDDGSNFTMSFIVTTE